MAPDIESEKFWRQIQQEYPDKAEQMEMARNIVLLLSKKNINISVQDSRKLWYPIEGDIQFPASRSPDRPVQLTTGNREAGGKTALKVNKFSPIWRVAAVLLVFFGLAYLFFHQVDQLEPQGEEEPIYAVHQTEKGTKSTFKLPDGSSVRLNSGSELRYIKKFEGDSRTVLLKGEAFFEVVQDKSKPFIVRTDNFLTTALGTSFNVNAFPGKNIQVSLVTGKVTVEDISQQDSAVTLEKGESAFINQDLQTITKENFDMEKVLAWTDGTILFDGTPVDEAVRILENWFGVRIFVKSNPNKKLRLYGKFRNETLKNILEGLSHSVDFDFTIQDKEVTIDFH
jgi:ferric-dicitrate binding protein FerR (iron transport regulator)